MARGWEAGGYTWDMELANVVENVTWYRDPFRTLDNKFHVLEESAEVRSLQGEVQQLVSAFGVPQSLKHFSSPNIISHKGNIRPECENWFSNVIEERKQHDRRFLVDKER